MLREDLHSSSWLVVRGTRSSSLPKPFDFLHSEKILKNQTKHHLFKKKKNITGLKRTEIPSSNTKNSFVLMLLLH